MSWLGKVLGGALGFALGGPLGALVGVALGHNLDRSARSDRGRGRMDPDFLDYSDSPDFLDSPDSPDFLDSRERTQTAFFTATFSVMGHLAKADGTRHPRRDTARSAGDGRDAAHRRPSPARPAALSRREGARLPHWRGPRSAPARMPVQRPSHHDVRRDPPARGVRRRRVACAGARVAGIHLHAAAPPRRGAGPPGDGARGASTRGEARPRTRSRPATPTPFSGWRRPARMRSSSGPTDG